MDVLAGTTPNSSSQPRDLMNTKTAYDTAITFCFEPTQENYDMIISSPDIKTRDDFDFDAWNAAIAYAYGYIEIDEIEDWVTDEEVLKNNPWANDKHEYINDDSIKMTDLRMWKAKFEPMDKELDDMLPSRSKAIKCISVYYASGEIKYIKMFHELASMSELDEGIVLTVEFNKIRDIYIDEVKKLRLAGHRGQYVNGLVISYVDFTWVTVDK